MQGEIRGLHVLGIIAGFFLITFLVNGVFVWRAVTSFPGEEVEKSYLQGLDYNRTLEQREAQAALGWGAEIGVDPVRRDQLLVRITDDSGSPVGGLDLEVLQCPHGQTLESRYSLESVKPGLYAAIMPVTHGRMQVVVEARRSEEDEVIFTANKTLVVS